MASDRWSSRESWGGQPPRLGEVVTIETGRDLLLDVNPPELGGLIIKGSLTFAEQDIELSARWILIDGGTLSIGSSDELHSSNALITLTGTDEDENIGGSGHHRMGTKCIAVVNGGKLELHGSRARSTNWTQLSRNALAGARSIEVAKPVDWKKGDQIVIAPSGFDPLETDDITIGSVVGNTVYFEDPLKFDHWGEIQNIGGHVVDQRAEVACLTRNIVIQGDAASAQSDFGGHLMFSPGTTVQVEGVEFYRMGQKGHAGRYPIHWHLAGDRTGDTARGNSIHHSYHRAIVVHGTSNVLVENNVSYDVWSHAFVPSEDGTETGNQFVGNLGILTRQLKVADYAFPISNGKGSTQSEGRPGVFWMKNPDHVLTGNHAAGIINGMGFFYDGPGQGEQWLGSFFGNVAHSCLGPSGTAVDRYPGITVGYGLFMESHTRPDEIRFQNFTAYKNTLSGLWLEAPGQHVQNAVLADNGTGAMLHQSRLEDAVIIGQSANTIGALPSIGTYLSGGIHIASDYVLAGPQLSNIDFVDQRDAGIVVLATKLHPLSTVENLTFANTHPIWVAEPKRLKGGITDLDGSLLGDGIPAYVFGNDALATTETTLFDGSFNTAITPLSSLLYLSINNTGKETGELGYTILKGESRTGPLLEMRLLGQAPTISGYLKVGESYQMQRFDPLPASVRIATRGSGSGFALLTIPWRADAFVFNEGISIIPDGKPDFVHPTSASASIDDLSTIGGSHWYLDSENDWFYQRLQGNRSFFLLDDVYGGLDAIKPLGPEPEQTFSFVEQALGNSKVILKRSGDLNLPELCGTADSNPSIANDDSHSRKATVLGHRKILNFHPEDSARDK